MLYKSAKYPAITYLIGYIAEDSNYNDIGCHSFIR